MGIKEWYSEIKAAQGAYDAGVIDMEVYDTRMKFAIGMIYSSGNRTDKANA